MFIDAHRITGQPISIRADDIVAVAEQKSHEQKSKEEVAVMLRSSGEWLILRGAYEQVRQQVIREFHALE